MQNTIKAITAPVHEILNVNDLIDDQVFNNNLIMLTAVSATNIRRRTIIIPISTKISRSRWVAVIKKRTTHKYMNFLWGVVLKDNGFPDQFSDLYSFGDRPTLCLNKRVKCCGYLNPNS